MPNHFHAIVIGNNKNNPQYSKQVTNMPCGISLQLRTDEPRQVVAARLAAAIAPAPSARIRPIRIVDWLSSYRGKSFVGSLKDDNFKLVLLNKSVAGIRWRGNTVVIVGVIEDNVVRVLLRPPIFILLFSLFWTTGLSFAFALSFFGLSNTLIVHLLLIAMLVLPLAILLWTFLHEARAAERALRNILGIGASSR